MRSEVVSASDPLSELIVLRERVNDAAAIKCTCSGFAIQYNGGCSCKRGVALGIARAALSDAIEALSPAPASLPDTTGILAVIAEMCAVATKEADHDPDDFEPTWTAENRERIDQWQGRLRDALGSVEPKDRPNDALDARRYRRLRVLGCAVMDTRELREGLVSRFTNLDEIVDRDLKGHPSRGEAEYQRPLDSRAGNEDLIRRVLNYFTREHDGKVEPLGEEIVAALRRQGISGSATE